MSKDASYTRLLDKVLGYLAYGQRTEKEIKRHLPKYFKTLKIDDPDKIQELSEQVLGFLSDNGLVDDDKYGVDFVLTLSKGRRSLGRNLIIDKLLKKGFNRQQAIELVDMNITDEDQVLGAVGLLKKKMGVEAKTLGKSPLSMTPLERQKMQRYLLGRGFSLDTIKSAVDYFLNHP